MRAAPIVLTVTLLASGCGDERTPVCPDGGTTLTYENFGRGFLDLNCNRCHAGSVMDRQGAPYELTFDTLDQVIQRRDRIYLRASGDRPSMPPGPEKPPADVRVRLAEWLSCAPP